jgi:hypothetical protein
MDENCLTQLQDALESTLENPAFLESVQGAVDVPLEYTSGEELHEAVVKVLDAPEALVALLENAYADE